MSIPISDKFKPKGVVGFALIDAEDVEMPDGTRLSDTTIGSPGITPHIGDNGNWYIGDTDTGKPSRGEPGEKGETGATGPQGEPGEPGYTPVKGTDYYTQDDKLELLSYAQNAMQSRMLPVVTTTDNDKILQVVNGVWSAVPLDGSAIATYIDNYINEAIGGEY